MTRFDGRADDELRQITFERDYTEMAAGSVLVSFGKTRVLCTASIDENVPRWMKNSGKGWVTAEYSMLPGASPERIDREAAKGKQSGRTVEIQRLIGRSLRAACDMQLLGERQVVVDCDVLQADGGTRTASICGGYLALHDALARLVQNKAIKSHPLHSFCAAISVDEPFIFTTWSETGKEGIRSYISFSKNSPPFNTGNPRIRFDESNPSIMPAIVPPVPTGKHK